MKKSSSSAFFGSSSGSAAAVSSTLASSAAGTIIRQKPAIWSKDVAKSLNVSRRDLSAAIRLLVGKTLDEMVKEWRMLQAMEQLRSTDLDILDIARQCGYSNTRHLSFAMEKRLHMTPYEYRYGAHRNDIRKFRKVGQGNG